MRALNLIVIIFAASIYPTEADFFPHFMISSQKSYLNSSKSPRRFGWTKFMRLHSSSIEFWMGVPERRIRWWE
jgi:hypothetical protein